MVNKINKERRRSMNYSLLFIFPGEDEQRQFELRHSSEEQWDAVSCIHYTSDMNYINEV
jgi:hypothetical protein